MDAVDRRLAAAAAAIACAAYVLTLAPGLVPIVDTPVFQFVGRVLGVPHNPGYPAYVLLTFVWSWLPVGSLAYRMNLFSAVSAAAAAGLLLLLCRRLGCGRAVSVAAALAFAFGRVFWSQAIIAEVYALNALLLLVMLLALVMWGGTRRPAAYDLAVAALAIALGNHTTIVLFVPGMIVYVLLTDARFALQPRRIAFVLVMAAFALAQYGFIILRTHTPGAYVESPARDLGELVDVIRGRQFADGLMAFSAAQVWRSRVPALFTGIVLPELTAAGAVLAAVGLARAAGERRREAWAIGLGGVMTFVFAANYDAVDIYVFLIPAFAAAWCFAAFGADLILRRIRGVPAAAFVLCAALPVAQLVRNYRVVDESRDTAVARYMDALVGALPDRALVLKEDFLVDRMVMYELLGAHAADGRAIGVAAADPAAALAALADGRRVFAFPRTAERLRGRGLRVSFAAERVLGDPLDRYLRDRRAGTLVAVAAPAAFAARVAVGEPAADSPVRVDSGGARAAITYDGREIAASREGAAVVIRDTDGTLREAFVALAVDGFRVPLSRPPLALYAVNAPSAPPDAAPLPRPIDAHSDRITMSRDEQSALAVSGWGAVEGDRTGPYRWIQANEALLTLPGTRPIGAVRVTMLAPDGPVRVDARAGGTALGAQTVRQGWGTYVFTVPPGVSASLPALLTLRRDRTARLAVGDVVLEYSR